MLHKIDYVSYTFKREIKGSMEGLTASPLSILRSYIPNYIDTSGEVKIAPMRYGFDAGYNIDNHTFIWCNRQGLFLVEHTGAGCDILEAKGELMPLILTQADNCTRIDIATDILTDTRPSDFANQRTSTKTTAIGYQKSDSGETVYVGSRKSDRTCKVYRYDGKHPRAAFLRIEYTYKGKNAAIIANKLKSVSIEEIAVVSGNRYKWQHDCFKSPTIDPALEIEAYRPERRQGKTVTWLYSQVIASIVRMSKEGHLDLEDYIIEIRKAATQASV